MDRIRKQRPTFNHSSNQKTDGAFIRVQAKTNHTNQLSENTQSQFAPVVLSTQKTDYKVAESETDSKKETNDVVLDKQGKASLVSTVMAESAQGLWEYREIAWVYLNLIRSNGLVGGLNKSTAYKGKNIWYKAYMIQLGEGADFKDDKPTGGFMKVMAEGKEVDAKTIGEYVEKNEYFKTTIIPRLNKMKEFVENEVLNKQKSNPIPSFNGQGYWRDLNNLGDKGDHWDMVRMYYVKFLKGDAGGKYIKVIGSGNNTTFLFDLNGIQKYFKDYPDAMPKNKKDIPLLLYDQLAPK
jgi:hypothetical protein